MLPDTPHDEQGMLKEKLDKALEEAWAKTSTALSETSKGSKEFEKGIWAAAEAVEYSSLLFSLTYNLEDVDPAVVDRKGNDTVSLIKESVQSLRRVRETRERSKVEAYQNLRTAAHYLKTAYLDQVKKKMKSG